MSDASAAPPMLRISVAVPSGLMVHAHFATALAQLFYGSHPLTLQLVNARSSIVAVARNNAVSTAQEFGADYILFLDSDMTFPPQTLLRLLRHRRDIVGATYAKRVPPFEALGKPSDTPVHADAPGLMEMMHIPTGCLLVRMGVFAALSRPYFEFKSDADTGVITGEDYVFCDKARATGFQVWCDSALSMELSHLGEQEIRLPGASGRQGGA